MHVLRNLLRRRLHVASAAVSYLVRVHRPLAPSNRSEEGKAWIFKFFHLCLTLFHTFDIIACHF
jgi:hypothetical protein